MNVAPRDPAVLESYPTFWDAAPVPAPVAPVAAEDAYTAFVARAEDDLPEVPPAAENTSDES